MFSYCIKAASIYRESIKVEKEVIQVNVILSEKDKILLENKGFKRKKRTIGVTEILEVIEKEFENDDLEKIGDILTQKFSGQIYDNRKEKIKIQIKLRQKKKQYKTTK